jgi:homoserine O-acetyltransferase/O-succinyltransferase
MEFQTAAGDLVPSEFITEEQSRQLIGRPPASGAWRDGDPAGDRQFAPLSNLTLESGRVLNNYRIAFETWGELDHEHTNAILILHGLTGDSHASGAASEEHPTDGWWKHIIGPGLAIDTNKYFVVSGNVLGGCQGSTGPSTLDTNGREFGTLFPYITIRDQVNAQREMAHLIGIKKWHAVLGGSVGAMHALEWAIMYPDEVKRVGVIAGPPALTADQIALNSIQIQAIKSDPAYANGSYYDAKPGFGPHQGLALARRMAILNYRSPSELNDRFHRAWQSGVSPLGGGGRWAVESYLDFHSNKFTRRFDANSYITLVEAMNSHDVGRGRESLQAALASVKAKSIVVGISSDRLFPIEDQQLIADHIGGEVIGGGLQVIESEFGHDGFLIEDIKLAPMIENLLKS